MRRLESLGSRRHLDRLVAGSLALQVHIRIRARQIPAARETLRRLEQLAQKYAASRACAWAEIPRRSMAARAELLHSQGEHHQVRAILEPLISDYERSGRAARCAELCLLCAAADIALGDEEAARTHTRKALDIASRYGLARLLTDHGGGCMTVLRALIETDTLAGDEFLLGRATLERWDAHPKTELTGSAAPEAASVGLSPRELDVLRLLARTHSNKSIGRVLNISAGTIKWHLSNIYGKLDAVSREDAVQKARKFHLIN
jgi:LuxR family maltose regulon positive regulatory protein